jgi:hypothetical protein
MPPSAIPPKNMEWPAPAGLRAEEVFPADWIVACTERAASAGPLAENQLTTLRRHRWVVDRP